MICHIQPLRRRLALMKRLSRGISGMRLPICVSTDREHDKPVRRSMWMLIQAGTMYCRRPARMTMPRPSNMPEGYPGAAAKKASH